MQVNKLLFDWLLVGVSLVLLWPVTHILYFHC